MLLSVLLGLFLILYSNLVIYRILVRTFGIRSIKEFFEFDEYSLVYVNIVKVCISALIIVISETLKHA